MFSRMGFTWVTTNIFLTVGSCVTTMNIKNVGSCVNNIHFLICSFDVIIIICPYSYWKMYAINVHKENIIEYKKAPFFLYMCESCQYVYQCLWSKVQQSITGKEMFITGKWDEKMEWWSWKNGVMIVNKVPYPPT